MLESVITVPVTISEKEPGEITSVTTEQKQRKMIIGQVHKERQNYICLLSWIMFPELFES
jgi:hypothetical protein